MIPDDTCADKGEQLPFKSIYNKGEKYCIIINRPSHQHRFSAHESEMNGRKCLYKDRDHPIKRTRNQLDKHRGTPDTHHRYDDI